MTQPPELSAFTPNPLDFAVMTYSFWSLEMTMAWIIWRDESRVAEHSAEYRQKVRVFEEVETPRGRTDRLTTLGLSSLSEIADELLFFENPGCSYDEAKNDLWHALGTGALVATAIEQASGRVVDIPASRWPYLAPWSGEPDRVCLASDFHREVFVGIKLPVLAILKIWSGAASSKVRNPHSSSNASSAKRGAKIRYNWEGFTAELARLIEYEGTPSPSADPKWIQARVEEKMAKWCSISWGKEPSSSTLRSKVSKFLASL
jgi:hypothetical protein